jgi:long-chain acyl-CoA synthetase
MALTASRLAVERPDEVALRDDRVALGWAEVDEALNRVANGANAMDLGPHRRYAVFAENSAETVLAHLGGLLAGVSTVPANFHLNAEELAYILSDSGAAALFVGPETASTGLAAAEQAGVPLVIGWRCPDLPDRPGVMSWDQWLAGASAGEPPVDPRPAPT